WGPPGSMPSTGLSTAATGCTKGSRSRRNPMPSYREWYSCDGWIIDEDPRQQRDGHPLQSSGQLSVFNPSAERAARLRLVVFHEEDEPTEHVFEAAPE